MMEICHQQCGHTVTASFWESHRLWPQSQLAMYNVILNTPS